MRSWRRGPGLLLAGVLICFALAPPAQAAIDAYPGGGGKFSGGAEGWEVTSANCDVALCSASGGYDGSEGNPAGSLRADTSISLNLLSLFHSTVTLQSPDFTVGTAGVATLHLERRFSQGSLVDLTPRLDYNVRLVDRSSGKRSTAISETIEGDAGWSGEDGAATVKAGHTYAIRITVRTSSSTAGTGLLAGSTSTHFDNVALSVDRTGASGGSGSGSGGSLTDARLGVLAPATLAGPAKANGKRVFVKARCPRKIGRACRISVLGLLRKQRPATAQRTVKVAKGKAKRLALRVKPRAKGKVAARKHLLFKVRVRAGHAHATAYKRLRLIRR